MVPEAIKAGDVIGVVAPSEIIKEEEIEEIESSKKFFENLGYKIKFEKYVKENSTGYGATAKQKAEDLNKAFKEYIQLSGDCGRVVSETHLYYFNIQFKSTFELILVMYA